MCVEWVGIYVGEIDYDDYIERHFGDNDANGVERGLRIEFREEEHVVDIENEVCCFFGWEIEKVVDRGLTRERGGGGEKVGWIGRIGAWF